MRMVFWGILLRALAMGLISVAEDPVLENDRFRVELTRTGQIKQVVDKVLDLTLDQNPSDSIQSFGLVLVNDGRNEEIGSNQQPLPRVFKRGNEVRFSWKGPLISREGEKFGVDVTTSYALTQDQISVDVSVRNKSSAVVRVVRYPHLSGLAQFPVNSPHEGLYIEPPFQGKPLALPFEATALSYPGHLSMAFVSVTNTSRNCSLYLGAHDLRARTKQWQFENVKGTEGDDVAVSLVHHPFIQPGDAWRGSPWILSFCEGDWVNAGEIYHGWFEKAFGIRPLEHDWIRRENCFQIVMMMLPEGNINFRFRDVPDLARQGLECGVTALQLAGWQLGGHDNGYPYYEPDPRLGTWEDVRWAIEECHNMGVKVFFFANLHWAMNDLEWFNNELSRYVSLNEKGKVNWVGYWGMGTIASRMGYTPPTMSLLNVSFPGIADPTVRYFRKLAELGADGIHLDKYMPGNPEYNPGVAEYGFGPEEAGLQSTLDLTERILRECSAVNPGFGMSFETSWDRVFSFGTATWWWGYMPLTRWVFPENAETTGDYWPYDYVKVNDAVRDGIVLMLAPFKFNRGMGDPTWRKMAPYIRETKRIRDRYADYIFLGRKCRPTAIVLEGATLPAGIQYAVWENRTNGRKAVVFTNASSEPQSVSLQAISGSVTNMVECAVPFEPIGHMMLPAPFVVPPERFVVLVENPDTHDLQPVSTVAIDHDALDSGSSTGNAAKIFRFDFEQGNLEGWEADANWAIDDNSAGGWYSGWKGKYFAWSGQGGESATGKLRSKPFVLEKAGVEVLLAGWADISGKTPDRWNYVTLNLLDGTELDRVYAPNTTQFTALTLDGGGFEGKKVFIEAVDNAAETSFSMLCLDEIRLVDLPSVPVYPRLDPDDYIILENEYYLVAVSKSNGAIVRIRDKKGGIDLICEPRLADNYAFTLPITGKEAWTNTEANQICGVKQRLTSYEVHPQQLTLVWGGPLASVFGVFYDVSVRMDITFAARDIVFSLRIDNRTNLPIGEVRYPIIGGTLGLGEKISHRRNTVRFVPIGSGYDSQPIYRVFNNMTWLGEPLPEQVYLYPHTLPMPWMYLFSAKVNRGVYFGAHDLIRRVKAIQLQQHPGIASNRSSGNWPTAEELDGDPAGVAFNFVFFPYLSSTQSFSGCPVVLRFQEGDVEQARQYYRGWFSKETGDIHAQTGIGRVLKVSVEHFSEINTLIARAKEEEFTAICVANWRRAPGTLDFSVDDGKGGLQALNEAAEACHEAGVGLFLLFQVQCVNPEDDSIQREFSSCLSKDRWGVLFTRPGDRWAWVGIGCPAVRERLVSEIAPLAQAGVDGLLVNNFFTDKLDFNEQSGTTPDRADWDNGLETLRAILSEAQRLNPNFRLITDSCRDHLNTLAPLVSP